jgi:hypothetical protein
MPTPREQWDQLSPVEKGGFVTVSAVDVALRVWALVDLARRPSEQIHGRKGLWATGLAVVNSAGLLPAAYLLWGRKASG